MTLQECYVKIGGDYNDILHRFMNENMVRKFVLKFPQDNNMALFEESWAKKDYETAWVEFERRLHREGEGADLLMDNV